MKSLNRLTPLLLLSACSLGGIEGEPGGNGRNGENGTQGAKGEPGAPGPQGERGESADGIEWEDVTGTRIPQLIGANGQVFGPDNTLWSVNKYSGKIEYVLGGPYYLTLDCTGPRYFWATHAPRIGFRVSETEWRVAEDDAQPIKPTQYSQKTNANPPCYGNQLQPNNGWQLIAESDTRIVTPPTLPGTPPYHPVPAE